MIPLALGCAGRSFRLLLTKIQSSSFLCLLCTGAVVTISDSPEWQTSTEKCVSNDSFRSTKSKRSNLMISYPEKRGFQLLLCCLAEIFKSKLPQHFRTMSKPKRGLRHLQRVMRAFMCGPRTDMHPHMRGRLHMRTGTPAQWQRWVRQRREVRQHDQHRTIDEIP